MRWQLQLRMRLRSLLQRAEVERDLDDELLFHIEERIAHEIAAGATPAEARSIALRSMDGLTQRKEECREAWHMAFIDNLIRDLRYTARSLGRNPGFAALAVAIMALGIGANTAVYSVIRAVLLKPLPYPNAERIVIFQNDLAGKIISQVTIADFRDWRQQASAFEAMAVYRDQEMPVSPGSSAEYARATRADDQFLRVFGVEPLLGRAFTAAEMQPGSRAVILSHAYWISRFDGDRDVLNRSIRVGTQQWPIVGVMPAGFDYPNHSDLWIPMAIRSTSRTGQNFLAVGRMKPGVAIEQARTEMRSIAARLEQQYPESNRARSVAVAPLRDLLVGKVDRSTLYLLLGVVGLVLLIACANTATLLLGRAAARTREIAVRSALGAGRTRIVRQLFTESLVLAFAAGAAGLALALWGSRALAALIPSGISAQASLDGSVLAFTLGVTLVTSLLFGVVPALHASRIDLNDSLKQTGRAGTGGRTNRLRGVLVVSEIALAVVLLTGAGLLLKSLAALHSVELGFDRQNVLSMRATGVATTQENNLFFREVLARLRQTAGVVAVGASMVPPGDAKGAIGGGFYFIDRMPAQRDQTRDPETLMTIVSEGSFAALGIPLKMGRDFNEGDTIDKPFVAIVNETIARAAFGNQNPIGRTIFCPFDNDRGMTIVGVVGDVRQNGPASDPPAMCYMPYRQHQYNGATLSVVVRTAADPTSMIATLRKVARDVSPNVPVSFTTMEETFAQNVAEPRLRALLFAAFAGLAVCLAMAGVYGVIAFAVGQRTSEIGLRMALGASQGSILRMILGNGFYLAAIGLVLGTAGAAAGSRLLTALLFEVQPVDYAVYAGVAVLLGLLTLLASYIPARRAARIDPLSAIRQE